MTDKLQEQVAACFQCQKCTNGCPVNHAMKIPPHGIIRMLQMGLGEELLEDDSIWVCAGCETCASRCPNDIEIAGVIAALKRHHLKESARVRNLNIPRFHLIFLESIRKRGRVFELGLISKYKLKTKSFLQDYKLGLEMFKRGKLKIRTAAIAGKKEVEELFQKSEKNGESQ